MYLSNKKNLFKKKPIVNKRKYGICHRKFTDPPNNTKIVFAITGTTYRPRAKPMRRPPTVSPIQCAPK